jgi:hypothetical protein
MDKKRILERIDDLIKLGNSVVSTKKHADYVGDYVDKGKQTGFKTSCLSFIKNLYGESHPYYKNFDDKVDGQRLHETESGLQILLSIKNEVEHDWLFSIRELVSAEIFANFLDMSKYLLDEKYKDAAAVMIGSVLEGHLKFLADKHNVDTIVYKNGDTYPKKADTLNTELTKAEIYNVLQQKNVTAWLDLRNKAAHAHYDQYSIEQVNIMYLGVLDFTSRVN